jgi:hypothetical protein
MVLFYFIWSGFEKYFIYFEIESFGIEKEF